MRILMSLFSPAVRGEGSVDPDRRYVFVYVGTGSVRLKTLYEVLPAVFPDGSHTIRHGGQNTIVQSLLHGAPGA